MNFAREGLQNEPRYPAYAPSFVGHPTPEYSSNVPRNVPYDIPPPYYQQQYPYHHPAGTIGVFQPQHNYHPPDTKLEPAAATEFMPRHPTRQSFPGVPPPTLSEDAKHIIRSRREKFVNMRASDPRSPSPQDMSVEDDQGFISQELISRNESERVSKKLDSTYEHVVKLTNITSEERINKLISMIKANLSDMNVQPFEFQGYVENYLSRMISEKKWTSLTVSTAIFLTVAAPVKVEQDSANAWYRCLMCQYQYPPCKFSCPMCGQKFKTKPDLYVHEFEHHGNFSSQHSLCEVCGMTFPKNPLGLRSHFRVHHMCQFEHLECMFGCKTLVLETHSRALAEHVYSCHACIECNDLLSSSLDKHLELFHSSLTTIDYEPDSRPMAAHTFQLRSSSPPETANQELVGRYKRQRSGSVEEKGNEKRMARDRGGTTFDEAKSFIDRLMDSGDSTPAAQSAATFNILDVQANRGTRKMVDGGSSKKSTAGLSLEDEINMMFARSASSSQKPPNVTAAPKKTFKKPYKNEGSLGELLFSQINVQKKVINRSPGQIKEDSPNELVILSDGEEKSRRGERVRKRLGDEYCEELLNRGKSTVPVYDNGLVYGGSPIRDISPDPLTESMQEQFLKSVKDGGKIHRAPRQYRKKSLSQSPTREVAKVEPSSTLQAPEKRKKTLVDPTKSKEVKPSKRSSKITCESCHFTIPREGFTCRICKRNYLMETDLAIHMKAKHQLRVPMKLSCSLCEKELADVAALHKHLISKHLCKEHVKCPFECDVLLSTDSIKQHLEQEHNRNYCTDCGKDYNKAKSHSCKGKKKVGIDKGELHSLLSGVDGVFSDDELKFVEVDEETETVSYVKDELVVIHLGAIANCESVPCLNVRRNRAGLVPSVSMTFSSKDIIQSRDFEMYARNGLFFCKSCPLVYDPILKACAECDLLFLDAKDLALHAVEVHKCSMDVSNVECDYCDKTFENYKDLLSHRGSHFCQEHTECTEGCKELIVGKKLALSNHVKLAHDSNPKATYVVFLGHVSSEATEQGKDVKVDTSNLVKCCNCRMKVPSGFELICDKCSRDNQLKFYSQDELTLHQEKQHRISKKGKFICSLGETQKSFDDDLEGLIAYRNKAHKICKSHVKCPRKECGAIMASGKLETHLRKECDYVSSCDLTLHPWFVFPYTEIKVCSLESCSLALQTDKLYKCPQCKAVMADKLEFYAHLKLDHKYDEMTHDVDFSCLKCNTSEVRFSVARWRNHRKDKHGFCSNHFVCVNMSCHLMFDSLSALRKHLQYERCRFKLTAKPAEFLGEKVCIDCNQIKAETVPRYCALCVVKPGSRPFTDNEEYSMHLTFRHNKTVQTVTPIKCGSCKTTLENFAEVGNHRIRKHKFCNKHVFCRYHESCQFVFHFKETDKPHSCSVKSKPSRNTPSKPSFSAVKSFLKCADCSFTANIRTSKSFVCEFEGCHKSFVLQNELCDHQSKRHKLTISGTFQCFRCPGAPSFNNTPDKLAEHNQKVHKFCRVHKKCPTPGCNWLFHVETDMDEHMQWCLGLKKYADQLTSSSNKSSHNNKETKSPEKQSSRDKEKQKSKRRNSVPEEGECTDNPGQGKNKRESPSKDIATQFTRMVAISDPVLFQCVDCTKKFWVDSLLECVKCGDDVPKSQKRFLSRTEMTAHLESEHHLITFTKTPCSMCGEKFDKCSELQKHMKSAHNSCETHYPCEFCVTGCSKMFGNLQKLQEHYAAKHFDEQLNSVESMNAEAEAVKCGLVSYGAEDEEETELKEPEQDILQELDEYAFEEPEGDEFPERENENGEYQAEAVKCGLVSYGAEDEEETELKEPEQDILQELDEYAFEEPEGDEFPERENENGDYQAEAVKCGLVSYGAEDEEETELKEPEQDILQELDEYAFEEPEGDEFPERENENGEYQAEAVKCGLVSYGAEDEEETELKEPEQDILQELDEYAFEEPEGDEFPERENENEEYQDGAIEEDGELEDQRKEHFDEKTPNDAKFESEDGQIDTEDNENQFEEQDENEGDDALNEPLRAVQEKRQQKASSEADGNDEPSTTEDSQNSQNAEQSGRGSLFESLDDALGEVGGNSLSIELSNSEENGSEDLELMINDDEATIE